MKAAIACSIRVATVAVLMVAAGVTLASAQCLTAPSFYPDFASNQSCLSLNGPNTGSPSFGPPPLITPPSSSAVLRLTKAEGNLATSAWYRTPQPVANGFSTTFSFQIGGTTSGSDADGIAFVIQNSSHTNTSNGDLTALGPGGCGIGFGGSTTTCANGQPGIPKSVAIEFNTFNNFDPVDPNTSNDVAIQSCGAAANIVDYNSACGLAHFNLASSLADAKVHTATITYTPSTLSNCGNNHNQTCSRLDVVLDTVPLFNGGVLFDITTIGLTDSTAYVGFTAGTGGSNDEQDILSWTFFPTSQTQTQTVNQGQTTQFNINGGFVEGNPTGYNFTAQDINSNNQQLQMTVTAIPLSQRDCSALVDKNPNFATAQCFVYQNGGGQGKDAAVLFEVTCPQTGSCGSMINPFDAQLGTQFSFDCSENQPLLCGLPHDGTPTSFGFLNITAPPNGNALPSVGFLKGEGPDPAHPCTPDPTGKKPLFQSNQIQFFGLSDTSGSVKGGSGGTTSCWVMTYLAQPEYPMVSITKPINGGTYPQGQQDGNTLANYSCSAVSTPAGSAVGPYLTIASSNCTATDSPGNTVSNGAQFDTTTLGPHTFTVDAQDSATNTNVQTVTYTVVAPIVPAAGNKCNGAIYTGTFKGNLTVTTGQTCVFHGGGVTGNVTQTGGTLVLLNAAVGGNLQVSGGTYAIGPQASVKNNLSVQNTPAGSQGQVCGAAIGGNLLIQNNAGAVQIGSASCRGNNVSGNMEVDNNAAPIGIFNNTVGGNLNCQQDPFITGSGNTAKKKQGQCAAF